MPTHGMDACSQWCWSHLTNNIQVLKCGPVGVVHDDILLLLFLLFFCSAGRS